MNRLHGTCEPGLIYADYDSTVCHTYGATQTMLYGFKYNVDLGLIARRGEARRGVATRRCYIACDAMTCIIARMPRYSNTWTGVIGNVYSKCVVIVVTSIFLSLNGQLSKE